MTNLFWIWAQFALCVLLIGVAGFKLSRHGDVIAEKTGMGGTWIGLILLATVTSLPELVTGISSVALVKAPDIAVGNVLGACIINLAMIVVLDLLHRGESIYTRAHQGHILSAAFGVILLSFVGFNILLASHGRAPAFGHVGLATSVIAAIYLAAMVSIFRYERAQQAEFVERKAERYADMSLRQAAVGYALAACVVVGAALWLPYVGAEISQHMGWSQSFVGTLFIALATTLPEMVVTVSALRLGAIDMAIANLFGSNLFNVFILAIDDLFFLQGPLFMHVSSLHAVSALSAVMMTGIAIVGLFYRPRTRVFRTVGWGSLFLLSIYLLNTYIVYLYGG